MASKLQPESVHQTAEEIDRKVQKIKLKRKYRRKNRQEITVVRKNKEELKQYYFVIKQLVDREIKRKYHKKYISRISGNKRKSKSRKGKYLRKRKFSKGMQRDNILPAVYIKTKTKPTL